MSDNKKIKDNPTCAELLNNTKGFEALSKVVSFFDKIGIKNDKISEAFKKFPDLSKKTEELINMPDRFNEHFSKSGWVAYESLNFELMKEAVHLADEGQFDEANNLLVEHYNEETLKWGLTFMKGVEEYRPRYDLSEKAKEDYLAGRYHACVPVVLTIIDGIVNDIEQKGFFAQGVDLTVWDSIAAHSNGLQELSKLFNSPRKKTNTETITVPYRHGILHGRDLGYANKVVAAKTWATLFTIRDWAMALKQGKKVPKEKEPEQSLLEVLKSYAKTQEQKKKLEAWRPRALNPDKDFPAYGMPEEFGSHTPERELAQFFQYWSTNNYGKMAGLMKAFGDYPLSKRAGEVRLNFQGKSLKGYKLLEIKDEASAITEITVEVTLNHRDKILTEKFSVRMIHEDSEGNPVLREEPGSNWRIIEHSFMPIFRMI
ncbi:MAG: hypothetical protein JRE47_09960 [Deltaproteobacteria bacterium]|nr:hypothetical protein [Deltaproteobacteria bacterium]